MKGFIWKWRCIQAEPSCVSHIKTFHTVQTFNHLILPQPTKNKFTCLHLFLLINYLTCTDKSKSLLYYIWWGVGQAVRQSLAWHPAWPFPVVALLPNWMWLLLNIIFFKIKKQIWKYLGLWNHNQWLLRVVAVGKVAQHCPRVQANCQSQAFSAHWIK